MNTITIQHADKRVTTIIKQLAEAFDFSFDVKKEKQVKYNPEFVRRVEDLRSGKVKPIKFDEAALKALLK
jgi:Class II histocompatibility antigen, alpha domain